MSIGFYRQSSLNSVKDRRNLKKIENLTTHNKYGDYQFPSCVKNISVEKLTTIEEEIINNYDYFAIDEAQFFEDLKIFVDKCLEKNKYIHCTGLISDSDKKPFGQIYMLVPYADEVKQLKAYCPYCEHWHKNAIFTKWIGSGEKNNVIEIGSSGKYIPVCGKHY